MPDRMLAATAGVSLAEVVAGPVRDARVLAAFPTAIYVLPEGGRALALVTRDGVALPNALVLDPGIRDLRRLTGKDGGAPEIVSVGAGALAVGGSTVQVDRWVDRRYRPGDVQPAALAERVVELERIVTAAQPLERPLGSRVAVLAEAMRSPCPDPAALSPDPARAAALALLGLGEGLTPSGDDVLAGTIAAGRCLAAAVGDTVLDHRLHDLGGSLLADAAARTTALSAALLWHAARAELAEPARHVLRALVGETPLPPAVDALLRVGHSSGRDLAVGIVLGVRTVLARRGAPAAAHPAVDRMIRT